MEAECGCSESSRLFPSDVVARSRPTSTLWLHYVPTDHRLMLLVRRALYGPRTATTRRSPSLATENQTTLAPKDSAAEVAAFIPNKIRAPVCPGITVMDR